MCSFVALSRQWGEFPHAQESHHGAHVGLLIFEGNPEKLSEGGEGAQGFLRKEIWNRRSEIVKEAQGGNAEEASGNLIHESTKDVVAKHGRH